MDCYEDCTLLTAHRSLDPRRNYGRIMIVRGPAQRVALDYFWLFSRRSFWSVSSLRVRRSPNAFMPVLVCARAVV